MSNILKKTAWNAERFGLTPAKIRVRLRTDDTPRVLCISIPKSGTHLVERALCLHPRLYRKIVPTVHSENEEQLGGLSRICERLRPGQIVVAHLGYGETQARVVSESAIRTIFNTAVTLIFTRQTCLRFTVFSAPVALHRWPRETPLPS